MNGYFYDSVFLVFEDSVRFFYSAEWKTMCDEWGSVYLSLLYKMKHFFAVASVYTTGLEGEVLAVHIWQRQYLGFVIKCYYCDYGVGRAHCQARRKVSLLPATSITRSAPPWSLLSFTKASHSSGVVSDTSG